VANAKKTKCNLLPYKRTDCFSIQEAQQKIGWGVSSFDLPKTWMQTKGEGVVIAVLDTGCDLDHPDLRDNLLNGHNVLKPNSDPVDDNGHGSHVAGVLVAKDNTIGMIGVCPEAKVKPVKVLDKNGNGNMDDVSNGIRWAADNGCDLITMSLGAPFKVQEVRKAIQYAESKGSVCFCAAGNAGFTQEIFYPANYPETISIGAIDQNFKRANFSNTGKNLDFMAHPCCQRVLTKRLFGSIQVREINNGIIGSIPYHPLLEILINSIKIQPIDTLKPTTEFKNQISSFLSNDEISIFDSILKTTTNNENMFILTNNNNHSIFILHRPCIYICFFFLVLYSNCTLPVNLVSKIILRPLDLNLLYNNIKPKIISISEPV
jgi:hypothetical protein